MNRICTYKRFSDNNIGQVGGDTNRCLTKSGMTSRSISLSYVQNASNYADNQLLPIRDIGDYQYGQVSIDFFLVNDGSGYMTLLNTLCASLEIYDSCSKEVIFTSNSYNRWLSQCQYLEFTWNTEHAVDIYPHALRMVPKLFTSTGTPITIYSSAQNPVPITYDNIPPGNRELIYYFGTVNVTIKVHGYVNFSSTSKVLSRVRLTVTNKITSYTSASNVSTTSSNYTYIVRVGSIVQVYDGTTLTLQFLDANGSILSVNGGQTSYQESFTGITTGWISIPTINLD